MINILYLGYFSTPETFNKICSADKSSSVAAHKFEQQLLSNLIDHKDINLTVITNIADVWEGREAPLSDTFHGLSITYVPTKRRSVVSTAISVIRAKHLIEKWMCSVQNQSAVILSYAINPIFMAALSLLNNRVKICTICSEVPQYRVNKGNSIVSKISHHIMRKYNENMDGYIFLTKYMNEVCNLKNKPWIVVEGLPEIRSFETKKRESNIENILFAGYLVKKNGISLLLDAFGKINNNNIKLVICGSGELSNLVERAAETDNRIIFKGYINNEEVLKLEKEATLLISTRVETNELTKYSFPSKLFEYYASGTAACISRLEGIPEKYYDFCFTCRCDNPDHLAEDIEKALKVPIEERDTMALKAYHYIQTEKSSTFQCNRIIQLLYNI